MGEAVEEVVAAEQWDGIYDSNLQVVLAPTCNQ